jgi:hypothetical protein
MIGTVLALVFSGVAEAGTMYTAPAAQSFPAPQELCCSILNTSTGARAVSMEVRDYAGNFIGGGSNGGLGPKEATRVCVSASTAGAYCKFEVSGSSRSFRAAALYVDANDVYTAAVPAQ